MKPARGRGRPAQDGPSPNNNTSDRNGNQLRAIRVNIGTLSMTLRSGHPAFDEAICAIAPTGAREHGDDGSWVIFGSAVDTVLARLSADGWTLVNWAGWNR